MADVLKISEAASIAVHAAALLAVHPDRVIPNSEIAAVLGVSSAHLAKVLQRLTRAGIVSPRRGPAGGFRLARPPAEITPLEVFEAIEGQLTPRTCLLDKPLCDGTRCVFGDLLSETNENVRRQLGSITLADVAAGLGG